MRKSFHSRTEFRIGNPKCGGEATTTEQLEWTCKRFLSTKWFGKTIWKYPIVGSGKKGVKSFIRRHELIMGKALNLDVVQDPRIDLKQQLLEVAVCDSPARTPLAGASPQTIEALQEQRTLAGAPFGVISYRCR
jgi:hypothetical protein